MIPRAAFAALLFGSAAALAEPGERITLYCGGGFTGGGGGVAAEADGRLLRLRRPRAGAPLEQMSVEGRTAPYARWSALLDAARFDTLPRGEPGNMTCGITRGAHHVMWPSTHTPTTLPAPLRDLVTEMRDATRE
ncbi:hypothetical protein KPL78_04405 [Roseomonas sp. HJA6]|uniref:Uncharacterized protein n=1 Tax=Roseomonas alba TaxID=2846776 RepID=A0ABS7A499_9PROT|nr:hypothetical protein [Neoroseomonas alba]MBW6397075.1 hypothetical protein [Neoroseomonas alba]